MTLNTGYKPNVFQGNGVIREFAYDFNPISIQYLKVYFEEDDKWVEQTSGWIATSNSLSNYDLENMNIDTLPESERFSVYGGLVTFDEPPTTRVQIARVITEEQSTSFKTSSGFDAKVVETSLDKLTGMIQQLQEASDRSVKVIVGDNQTPEELLDEVYERLDSSIEIAENAIVAAGQAQTAADNATAAVESAEQTLVETQAYVDTARQDITNTKNSAVSEINAKVISAKAEIDSTVDEATMDVSDIVSQGQETINQIISDAEVSIGELAVSSVEAQIPSAIQSVTQASTDNVAEYVSTSIRPVLESYTTAANNAKDTAIAQANLATTKAGEAQTYASNAHNSETNAKTSEDNAKASEENAEDYKDRCEEILERLGTAIKIKGRVNSLDDLPTSGNLDGDAYLVGEEGLDSYPEFYWYQNHWEFLGTSGGGGTWGTITGTLSSQTDLQTALDGKQDTLIAGNGIAISNNKISNTRIFTITEDMVTVTTDETKGVDPYNTAYGYTNVEISADSGIEWVEGALYNFIINTKLVVSGNYRNVRIRMGSTGDWKPLMGGSSTIANGSSYFIKAYTTIYQYKSVYKSGGALHVMTDNNTSYPYLVNTIPAGALKIDNNGYGARYSLAFPTTPLSTIDERFSSLVKSCSNGTTKVAQTDLTFYADRHPQYLSYGIIEAGGVSTNATYQDFTGMDLRNTVNTNSTYVSPLKKVFLWLKDFNPTTMSFKADATIGNIFSLDKIATRFPSSTSGDVYIYFLGWSGATWYTVSPNFTQEDKIFKYTPSTGVLVELNAEEHAKKQDIATAVNYSNITNCITEIPQDIKLELNDGTLTLKAGSKVYVPNGVGVFDAVTINSDITTQGSDNTQYILLYYPQGGYIGKTAKSNVFSGPDGSSVAEYGFWYDTTNNIIKRKLGGVFDAGGYSLPFGLSTATSSGIKSIDQVFNGFGYIGSTVFVLPGVKGLIPNGRNADGSLRNIEFTRNSVRVDTFTIATYTGTFNLYSFSTHNVFQALQKYDEITNTMGDYAGSFITGIGYLTKGTITSFKPKTPFHAVDWNDYSNLKDKIDDKLDKNSLSTVHCVISTYVNGTSGYRIYDDGYCEQWGRTSVGNDNSTTVSFTKTFKDTNYTVNWISVDGVSNGGNGTRSADTLTVNSFRMYNGQDVTMFASWRACGYLAEGQY